MRRGQRREERGGCLSRYIKPARPALSLQGRGRLRRGTPEPSGRRLAGHSGGEAEGVCGAGRREREAARRPLPLLPPPPPPWPGRPPAVPGRLFASSGARPVPSAPRLPLPSSQPPISALSLLLPPRVYQLQQLAQVWGALQTRSGEGERPRRGAGKEQQQQPLTPPSDMQPFWASPDKGLLLRRRLSSPSSEAPSRS